MRTPPVTFYPDETIKEFIEQVVGTSTQDIMIGSEILFGAGLALREVTLVKGRLTIHFHSTPALKSRLEALSKTDHALPAIASQSR